MASRCDVALCLKQNRLSRTSRQPALGGRISYVAIAIGFLLYLAVILDAWSRRVVG
jgi:hypothetical protein